MNDQAGLTGSDRKNIKEGIYHTTGGKARFSNYLAGCMALFVSSLNSGSNGNCYYIGNDHEAVLVDGGISCREIEKRLKRLNLNIRKIKAVFVSHEHGDHVHGIPALARKHRIPVYLTQRTFHSGELKIAEELINPFYSFQPVAIGDISVTGFPKRHDAADAHSFVIAHDNIRIGVFTDIGHVCENVIQHFRICHAAFLEANYDEDMLEKGGYPWPLKNRIRGGYGHLSNRQALRLFREHKPSHMSHLFLSHLSRENNSPSIVAEMFTKVAGKTEVIIASRYEETSIYRISNDFSDLSNSTYSRTIARQSQLSLF
jgi:phosphoribosyl 1,2-cyclic phosphodiesterase